MFARMLGLAAPVNAVYLYTKTGQTLRGVLVDRRRDVFVLRMAQLASEQKGTGGQVWTRMPGDVAVLADNVDFWQESIDPSFLEG